MCCWASPVCSQPYQRTSEQRTFRVLRFAKNSTNPVAIQKDTLPGAAHARFAVRARLATRRCRAYIEKVKGFAGKPRLHLFRLGACHARALWDARMAALSVMLYRKLSALHSRKDKGKCEPEGEEAHAGTLAGRRRQPPSRPPPTPPPEPCASLLRPGSAVDTCR